MTNALRIPVSSTEYLKVSVTADVTLSAQTVDIAAIATHTRPADGDWLPAQWTGSPGQTRTAVILIGPESDNPLPLGVYDIWVKVGDTPEVPTELAGRLTVC